MYRHYMRALVFSAVICGCTKPITPCEELTEDNADTYKRVRDNAKGGGTETAADYDCTQEVRIQDNSTTDPPRTLSGGNWDVLNIVSSVTKADVVKCLGRTMATGGEDMWFGDFWDGSKPADFFACLQSIAVRKAQSSALAAQAAHREALTPGTKEQVYAHDVECGRVKFYVAPQNTTDSAMEALPAVPMILELLGPYIISVPAGVSPVVPVRLLRQGSDEEACADVPQTKPAKRCTGADGCPDVPPGAEVPGGSSSGGGDIIPPGTDPGTPVPGDGTP